MNAMEQMPQIKIYSYMYGCVHTYMCICMSMHVFQLMNSAFIDRIMNEYKHLYLKWNYHYQEGKTKGKFLDP